MNPRNLRNVFMAGAALRHILMAGDGEDDGGAGGGAPPAEPPAAEPHDGDPPPEGGAGAGGEGGEGGSDDPPPAPKPQRTPWQAKRIDALTAQAKTAQEEADRLRRENQQTAEQLAAYRALYGDNSAPAPAGAAPAAPAPSGERTYTRAELQEEAARIASVNTLNQKLENLYDQGATKYDKTWKANVDQAGQAFGKELMGRIDFFEALSELPNGVDVYHELTGDLDHMSDVLAMSPLKLGMELTKMSTKLGAKPAAPKVSQAPSPIDPIDGSGPGASDDLAKMSMNDFAKTREKQREERFKSRGY